MKIAFLFTCYNRIEKTKKCIESVDRAIRYANDRLGSLDNAECCGMVEAEWYVVDAGSTDGTVPMLHSVINESGLHIREEKGAYYSQGMRVCIDMARSRIKYAGGVDKNIYSDVNNTARRIYMLINDDVEFYEDYIYKYLIDSKYINVNEGLVNSEAGTDMVPMVSSRNGGIIYVGATDDGSGKQTYGGIRYRAGNIKKRLCVPQSIRYDTVSVDDNNKKCHTFNANCVIIPGNVFAAFGNIDEKFVHGLGDFDLGMCTGENGGVAIMSTSFYVGRCLNNSKEGTWMDASLPRIKRIKLLNSVKGSPTKQWFYYLNKHFGLATALVHSVSPYVRIMVGR